VINLAEKADLDLAALIQWLANEKKIRITTNSDKFPGQRKNKVIFYGDIRVSPDSMLEIVQSILRTNGFAIVRSEVDDLFQIVELGDARPFTPIVGSDEVAGLDQASYATVIFSLKHIKQSEAQAYLNQLLYGSSNQTTGGNITGIANRNTLVVTETAKRLSNIIGILKQIDVPPETVVRQFYQLKNTRTEELKEQLEEIFLTAPSTSTTNASQPNTQAQAQLKINAIQRTNQLLFSGLQEQVVEAVKIAEKLDVENQSRLQTYQFRFTTAKRVDELIRQKLGGDESKTSRLYQSSVNEQSNQLIVTTRDDIHQQIQILKQQLDVESSEGSEQSPVRFYTLKNVKVADIVVTLQSITGQQVSGGFPGGPTQIGSDDFGPSSLRGVSLNPNNVNAFGGASPFAGPNTGFGGAFGQNAQSGNLNGSGNRAQTGLAQQGQGFGQGAGGFGGAFPQNAGAGFLPNTGFGQGNSANGIQPVIPGDARITTDENTNTLIVVAAPDVQKLYAELIEKLDVRRPQVLVEIRVVTISAVDSYNFGVEVSGGDRTGVRRLFGLTSFGLSTIDAATGALAITPGLGFNGTLVDPETADVVLRALATHSRARVLTAPQILVNDNATGLISSVAEVPFASQSTSTAATSTTSFGGFAQAGTTISVTPQISDNDYLNLEFDVLVNSFIGTATDPNIPPGRNTDQVTSQVAIPDGHTVIVGGLTSSSQASDFQGLPWIERIPILRRLASNETNENSDQRLFVFIKPVILRDDKFRDLRFLSKSERQAALLPDDLPHSEPVLIR